MRCFPGDFRPPEAPTRNDRSAGPDLDPVITLQAIDRDRGDPAEREEADNDVAEDAEVVVQLPDKVPEWPLEAELIADQPQGLDPADDDGHDNRNEGDREVVEQ